MKDNKHKANAGTPEDADRLERAYYKKGVGVVKTDRKSATGTRGEPKKKGGGGKYVWGKPGDEVDLQEFEGQEFYDEEADDIINEADRAESNPEQ